MTDRKKLIELLDNFSYALDGYRESGKYIIFDNHIELADHLIANDVKVQKHGWWVWNECGWWQCSECACSPADWEAKPDNEYGLPPFCHCCGAKMMPQPPKGE